MDDVTALIPVKKLHNAKSRLKNSLQNKQREMLVITMFSHVASILQNIPQISHIYVVTNDKTVEKLAKDLHVQVIDEKGQGLNTVLTNAVKNIHSNKPMLTIFADLPLLKIGDVEQMLHLVENNDLVIAPAKNNSGTNAIMAKQPLIIPYVFGENSYKRFLEHAKQRNIAVGICESESIAFDVDTKKDLKALSQYSNYSY